MAVRSKFKGEVAAAQLYKETANSVTCAIEVGELDMLDYTSIRAFTARCEAELSHIDIVLLNAGLRTSKFERHPEIGHEISLQVNVLCTALLSTLLVPILAQKAKGEQRSPPRLCCVASETVYMARMDMEKPLMEQIDDENSFMATQWYPNTKLMILMFMIDLAKRVDPKDVIINCTNPGMTSGASFNTDTGTPVIDAVVKVVKAILSGTLTAGDSAHINSVVSQGKNSHRSFTSVLTTLRVSYDPLRRARYSGLA